MSLPPGFAPTRLVRLMRRSIAGTGLDLSGMTVLTEAATRAYGVTPVIAAMAGARQVHAVTRPSRYGSVEEVADWTSRLAQAASVADRITVCENLPDDLSAVDLVTNSGHLRPLTAQLVARLPPGAVIALMFEAWEFRPEDIDLAACVQHGVPVVGVNERHATVDVFSFLGELCAKQLHDCGLAVYGAKLALLCDNDFAGPMRARLTEMGAYVEIFAEPGELYADDWDAAVVALLPTGTPQIADAEAASLAAALPPEALLVQFWGDLDRAATTARGLNVWPLEPPTPGHMAVLLSEIGPEPIVRLQTGGLRAAEWVRRGGAVSPGGVAQLVQPQLSPGQ